MTKTYKKTFDFGKVAYNGKNKKNLVRVDVELQIKDNKPVFTASGEVWQSNMRDIEMGGQCLDEIWKEFEPQLENSKLFYSILLLWRKWHLNDMHAECEHQEQRGESWATHPSAECPQCGWKLGHGWSYRAIPRPYLADMINLFDMSPTERVQIYKMAKGAK